MSKRELEADDTDRRTKRPRQEHTARVQEILFARQLQDCLSFAQDGIPQLRDGIASFKAFLESILYHREEDNRARQLSILREYLESQKPPESQEAERPFLHQLWQAWSFADQNNNDHLGSAVSSILAQLLKTLSNLIQLREYGSLLCKTVLQHQHLRLLKRCLSAPSHKEFLISPSLRLITEVTGFDGGVFARQVYKRREQTFDIGALRRNLGLVKNGITEEELQRKPAIRTLTLRYILAHLKYLHEGGKADILKNRPLCTALFSNIHADTSDLVIELLNTTEQNVLKDNDVPRVAKANLLTSQCLQRIAEIATRSSDDNPASERAFTWLESVCTKSSYGVLRLGGWYPARTESWESPAAKGFIDLGLDSMNSYDREATSQVRNPTLLSWIQTLRPHSDLKERKLLVKCLSSAPELVAAYFSEKGLQMEPKLSNTWIGYASLLFEIICLPIPDFMGNENDWAEIPPPTNALMEGILPSPLSQKVLTRCLNQSNELITFFAVRILVVAFQKLDRALQMMRSRCATIQGGLWEQAIGRAVDAFVQRCPNMKDVIQVFRQTPDDDERAVQREANARLLALFYKITPLQALEEQFDVSGPLTAALTRSGSTISRASAEVKALRLLELEHLLVIAGHSPGMRWYHKQGALQYTPIVTLLRLHILDMQNSQSRRLIERVLTDSSILSQNEGTRLAPVDALVASLSKVPLQSSVWDFVDDCIARASRQPIKYVDILESIQTKVTGEIENTNMAIPSPLAAVIHEQAAFVVTKPDADRKTQIEYVNHFLELFTLTTADEKTFSELCQQIRSNKGWKKSNKAATNVSAGIEAVKLLPSLEAKVDDAAAVVADQSSHYASLGKPPIEPDSHPELYRWSQKEFDMALEEGDIGALMLCLCSEHTDVRIQAHVQLSKLALQLRSEVANDNARQISVLIGELCETFEKQYLPRKARLPYLVGTFAARALEVQTQPSHWMYPKLNQYFIRGPEWRTRRLPSYWLSKSILSLPEDDDAYWLETQWVVDWLVDGLRTPADIDIFRRCDVFERIMTLWTSPGAARLKSLRERVFELLFRTTYVDGGSSTLVTRTGLLSWLVMVSDAHNSAICDALRRRIAVTCDAERLQNWAGSGAILVN